MMVMRMMHHVPISRTPGIFRRMPRCNDGKDHDDHTNVCSTRSWDGDKDEVRILTGSSSFRSTFPIHSTNEKLRRAILDMRTRAAPKAETGRRFRGGHGCFADASVFCVLVPGKAKQQNTTVSLYLRKEVTMKNP